MIRPSTKANKLAAAWLPRVGFFIHGLWSGSPPDTRGRSPVRKIAHAGICAGGYPVLVSLPRHFLDKIALAIHTLLWQKPG